MTFNYGWDWTFFGLGFEYSRAGMEDGNIYCPACLEIVIGFFTLYFEGK